MILVNKQDSDIQHQKSTINAGHHIVHIVISSPELYNWNLEFMNQIYVHREETHHPSHRLVWFIEFSYFQCLQMELQTIWYVHVLYVNVKGFRYDFWDIMWYQIQPSSNSNWWYIPIMIIVSYVNCILHIVWWCLDLSVMKSSSPFTNMVQL